MAQSVVSAEADQRMAMDAMRMAVREADRVKAQMQAEATDANWWAWQVKVKQADRAVNAAAERVVEASKAVCRANMAEAA